MRQHLDQYTLIFYSLYHDFRHEAFVDATLGHFGLGTFVIYLRMR